METPLNKIVPVNTNPDSGRQKNPQHAEPQKRKKKKQDVVLPELENYPLTLYDARGRIVKY